MKKRYILLILGVLAFILIFASISKSDGQINDNIINRTASTETIKNQDNTYTLTIYSGKMFLDDKTMEQPHYVQFNETFFSLINSTNPLYDYELNQYYNPQWKVYFKSNPTQGQIVKYIVNDTEITFQPMALNYRNDLNQIQQINIVSSVIGQPIVNKFIYQNVYGNGINLTYENKLNQMKENLIIDNFSRLPLPQQYILDGGNATLDMDFIITTNSKMVIDNVEWDKKTTASSNSNVLIKDNSGNTLYELPAPIIKDSNNSQILGKYEFKKSGQDLYIIIKTDYNWLKNATFPVYIDPTITLTSIVDDAYVNESSPNTNYGASSTAELNNATQGKIYAYYKFKLDNVPSNILLLDAQFKVLMEKSQGSFYEMRHVYNQSWTEEEITWNNQPCGINITNSSQCNLTATDNWYALTGSSLGFVGFNIYDIFKKEYPLNNNLSLIINTTLIPDENYNTITFKEYIGGNSKLVITYQILSSTLVAPSNNSWTNDKNVNFSCSSTLGDGGNLKNITLFLWNQTAIFNNENNKIISGITNSTNISLSIDTDDTYEWNCYVCDISDNCVFDSSNNTLNLDTKEPYIYNVNITTETGNKAINFSFNYTEINLDSCWYSILNASGGYEVSNTTINCDLSSHQKTLSDFGTYNLIIYANDSAGNENSTNKSFSISIATTIITGGGGQTIILQDLTLAENFSITTSTLGNKQDLILAKGSVKPRAKYFILTNKGNEPINVTLVCSATDLESNETFKTDVEICDYVTFENDELTVSANEDSPTIGKFYVKIPENASFDDVYGFNILAIEESEFERYSKLSVTTRVPIWGLIYKYSYLPLQGKDKENKSSYPVISASILLSMVIFSLIMFVTRKKFPLTGFIFAVIMAMIIFIVILIEF